MNFFDLVSYNLCKVLINVDIKKEIKGDKLDITSKEKLEKVKVGMTKKEVQKLLKNTVILKINQILYTML